MKNHTTKRSAVGISLIIVSILVGIFLANWPSTDASGHASSLTASTTPPTITISLPDISHTFIRPQEVVDLTIDTEDEEAQITTVRYVPYFVDNDTACAESGAADLTAVRRGSSNRYSVLFTLSHRSLCVYVDYEKNGHQYTHYESLDVNTVLISDLGQTGLEKKLAVTLGDRDARILAVRYKGIYPGGATSAMCVEVFAPDTDAQRPSAYPGMLVAQGEGIYLTSFEEAHSSICVWVDYEKDGLKYTHAANLETYYWW